ncbi:MAG: hypothetical protein P4M11_09425 [Candidatus Pacebacteria bacterium]|nr:hypothetical protein [Candidatus Paceibacterota bacterium]
MLIEVYECIFISSTQAVIPSRTLCEMNQLRTIVVTTILLPKDDHEKQQEHACLRRMLQDLAGPYRQPAQQQLLKEKGAIVL